MFGYGSKVHKTQKNLDGIDSLGLKTENLHSIDLRLVTFVHPPLKHQHINFFLAPATFGCGSKVHQSSLESMICCMA
ncbi:hypothetical protein SLE2022_318090 [Rubroshorea leprosula]